MLRMQQRMMISSYINIFDVVPKNNKLRLLHDLIDFNFIQDELETKYSINMGREGKPVLMFKYLLLKTIFNLSDRDVIERSRYDMSFKLFLDIAPESTAIISPSALSKFRRQRLKDMEILDILINKTVELAIKKGVIKSRAIIVDATHTKSKYNLKSAIEILRERSKALRRSLYEADSNIKESLPKKNTEDILEKEIEYSKELIKIVKEKDMDSLRQDITERLNFLEETIEDNLEHLKSSKDEDARVGHKTADTSFFGYKTHLAMTKERIIVAATVTSGEKADGKELPELVRKSRKAGMNVRTVIGDKAYSGKDNIQHAKENDYELVARLNRAISQGTRTKEEEFLFNKDAGMYQCKAGHLAIKKAKEVSKTRPNKNPRMKYYFDIEKCKHCPQKEGCYKEGSKTKTYSETILCDEHSAQAIFEQTDYFKNESKERYKIEAKNSELKHRYGYDVSVSPSGLVGMELQGALAIFAANIKRIMKLSTKR